MHAFSTLRWEARRSRPKDEGLLSADLSLNHLTSLAACIARAPVESAHMGSHLFFGLPRSQPYKRVVALLGNGAGGGGTGGASAGSLAQVADATLEASVDGLERAKADPGLAYCVHLLVLITRAARNPNSVGFIEALHSAGIPSFGAIAGLPDAPRVSGSSNYTLYDLTSGFTAAVDRHLRRNRIQTEMAELAQFAAAESLSALCGPSTEEQLFDSQRDVDGPAATDEARTNVQKALRNLSTQKGFARLAHDFFARTVRKYLEYHLSRELPNHVGAGRRFHTADEHNQFLRQLDEHCRTSTRVMRQFAGEWYSLHNFRGDLTLEKTRGFAAHALDKVRGAMVYQEKAGHTKNVGGDHVAQ